MAVTATTLGGTGSGSASTTYTHDITAAVPAGDLVVVAVAWTNASGVLTPSCSGGSLTWTTDFLLNDTEDGAGGTPSGIAFFSAPAPSGLSSATTITITFDASASWGCNIESAYLAGADTGASRVDGTPTGQFRATAGTGAWSSGSMTTSNADDGLIGVVWGDGANSASNTAGTNWTDLDEGYLAGNQWPFVMTFRAVSSAGSYDASGTLDDGEPVFGDGAAIIAYKAAGGGGSSLPSLVMAPMRPA